MKFDQSVADAISKYQTTGDKEAAKTVLTYLQPTIDTAIYSYAGGERRYRVPAANIALRAMQTYDPSRGTDPKTHVHNALQRLQRISAQRSEIIHIPENVSKDFGLVQRGRADYEDRYGVEPSDQDLADFLSIPIKRINVLEKYRSGIPEGVLRNQETGDTTVGFNHTPDRVYLDYLYRSVGNTDRKILELGTNYNGRTPLPVKDIAARLKVTPSAVSQRMTKLTKMMADLKGMV